MPVTDATTLLPPSELPGAPVLPLPLPPLPPIDAGLPSGNGGGGALPFPGETPLPLTPTTPDAVAAPAPDCQVAGVPCKTLAIAAALFVAWKVLL
jgi:hypothetical protein